MAPLLPIPGEVPGQTLVARQLFTDDISSGPLPNYTGTLLGSQTNGPTFLDALGQRVSYSGAIARPTRAEFTAGTGFSHQLAVPAGPARTCGNARILMRLSENAHNNEYFLQHIGQADPFRAMLKIARNSNESYTLTGEVHYQQPVNLVTAWPDEWLEIYTAWEFLPNSQCSIAMYAVLENGGTPILMRSMTVGFAVEEMRTFQFGYNNGGNRWCPSGRIACMEIRSATSFSNACEQPGALIWPTNARRTHNVSSWQDHVTNFNNNVSLSRHQNYTWNGTLVRPSSFADNGERLAFSADAKAGVGVQHRGDKIVFPAGDLRVGTTAVRGHPYVELEGNGLLIASDAMTGGWTQVATGGGVTVYRYAGANGGSGQDVWMIDGNDWITFRNCREVSYASGGSAALLAEPWTVFTDPTDLKTYISVPSATNPALYEWEGSKLLPTEYGMDNAAFDITGSYIHGFTFRGLRYYNYDANSANPEDTLQNGWFVFGAQTITIMQDNVLCDAPKHALSYGSSVAEGYFLRIDNEYAFGPPRKSGNYGAVVNDLIVDNPNDSTTSPSSPGRYVTIEYVLPCPRAVAVQGLATGVPLVSGESTYFVHNDDGGVSGWQIKYGAWIFSVAVPFFFPGDVPPPAGGALDVFQTVQVIGP